MSEVMADMTGHYSEPEMNTKETSNLYQQLHYSEKLASVNLESLNLSFYLESRLIEGFLQPAQYNFFFIVNILELKYYGYDYFSRLYCM